MRAARAAVLTVVAWLLGGTLAVTAPDLATVTPAQLAGQAEQLGGSTVSDPSFVGGPAIRIPATPVGTALRLPAGLPWASARFLTMSARVDAEHSGEILVRFFAADEAEPRLVVSLGPLPRAPHPPGRSSLRARRRDPVPAPHGGPPQGPGAGQAGLPPGEIGRVEIQLKETAGPATLYLGTIGLGAEEPRFSLPREPLVDDLGQWLARDWEGKTRSDAFLGTQMTFALEEHEDASYPKTWCPRGGTTEKVFEATGFFRTEHDGERWWLVDPEGHGFYSLGLNAVRPGESATIVPGSEALFGRLPSKRGPMGEAWGTWGPAADRHLLLRPRQPHPLLRAGVAEGLDRDDALAPRRVALQHGRQLVGPAVREGRGAALRDPDAVLPDDRDPPLPRLPGRLRRGVPGVLRAVRSAPRGVSGRSQPDRLLHGERAEVGLRSPQHRRRDARGEPRDRDPQGPVPLAPEALQGRRGRLVRGLGPGPAVVRRRDRTRPCGAPPTARRSPAATSGTSRRRWSAPTWGSPASPATRWIPTTSTSACATPRSRPSCCTRRSGSSTSSASTPTRWCRPPRPSPRSRRGPDGR